MSYRIVNCPICDRLYKEKLLDYRPHKFNGCEVCRKEIEDKLREQERKEASK